MEETKNSLDDIWNLDIISKWPTVYFTGPKLKVDPYELVVRLDSALNTYGVNGNDSDFNYLIKKWQHSPEKSEKVAYNNKIISFYSSPDKVKETYGCSDKDATEISKDLHMLGQQNWAAWDEEYDKFNCYWGQFKDGYSIFHVDLLSSCHGEPSSWFNPKTGKIGGWNTFGKWPEKLGVIRSSVEWFVKEFPEVDVTLSVFDEDNVIAQLHLHDGKIESEEPNIPMSTFKKLDKINWGKKSDNKWQFSYLRRFYRRHLMTKKARHSERCNIWKLCRHYNEQFFSWETVQNLIEWWVEESRDYWKEHSFEDAWSEYQKLYLEDTDE